MKVLHLTTHLNTGGITNYILRLVEPLKDRDIEFQIVSSGGEYHKQFTGLGCKSHVLNIKTKSELSPKIYLAIPKLIRLIKDEGIDVLHAHTRVTQVLAFWVGFFTKVPVVTTCHGFYKHRLGRKLNPAWGHKVIAISDPVGAQLNRDFKVPLERIRVINNAINLDELDAQYNSHQRDATKRKYGFTPEDNVVGIVARLVKDKGHEYLLEAIHALSTQTPHIKLLIVGDGRERKNLGQKAQALAIQDKVVFTGNVVDVTEPLSAIDVFAFPATWREGFGLSIIEAMACSKPVIVTNIWALNSLIENNKTGILVEPKRSDVLADAIDRLLGDESFRKDIGRSARNVVQELFTIDRMADELASAYAEVCRSGQSKTADAS